MHIRDYYCWKYTKYKECCYALEILFHINVTCKILSKFDENSCMEIKYIEREKQKYIGFKINLESRQC